MNSSSKDIVVNMTITANTKHDYKLLTVSGPKRPAMQSFMRSLEEGLSGMSHFWVSRFSDSVKRDFRISFQDEPAGSTSPVFHSIAETGNQSYKTEEAAYYYFYKILSNRGYSIGSELGKFISEFVSHFPIAAPPPPPMDTSPSNASEERASIHSFASRHSSSVDLAALTIPAWSPQETSRRVLAQIDLVVSQFDKNYLSLRNPSTTLVDDLLPRLRPAVERYVFEAVGRCVWAHYRQAYLEEDKSFHLKSLAIRGAHSDNLAESCGIRPEFRFTYDRSVALMNDLQYAFDSLSAMVPNSLLQKLLSVLISVKREVLAGTQGAKELESMDDIAPIFLFALISGTELKSPNALYHFLLDTMPQDQRMETEGRTVALLEGATRLVMNDWPAGDHPLPPTETTHDLKNAPNLLDI